MSTNLLIGLLTIASYLVYIKSATENFSAPDNVGCACIGDILTFNCTAMGGGGTQWGGTTFNCPRTSDEIVLRHSLYTTASGTSGDCNEGAVTARSIAANVTQNSYTSQLSMTVQNISSVVTIECIHDSSSGLILIGDSTIKVVSAPYSSPSIANLLTRPGNITFIWNPVAPQCPSLSYNITFNDCGECSQSITNSTSITCFYKKKPPMCTFGIQSITCGFSGNPSIWTIKPPDRPSVDLTPHYSNNSRALIKATLIIATVTNASLIGTLNITHYYISSSSKSEKMNTCISSYNDVCMYIIDLSPGSFQDSCQAVMISVNISAINAFGEGPPWQQDIPGCNQLVRLEYNNRETTFYCLFLNESDTFKKSCNITYNYYGKNGIHLSNNTQANSSEESPGIVSLKLDLDENQLFNYTVTAASTTFSIILEGRIDNFMGDKNRGCDATCVKVISSTAAIVIFIGITIIIIIICCSKNRKHVQRNYYNEEYDDNRGVQQDLVI